MSKEKQIDIIIDLLTEFDEMGFIPSAMVPDTEAYAIKWRERITNAFEEYRKQSRWISVDDRLPESRQMVLCYTPCDGYIFVGYYQEVEQNPYFKSYWNIITAMRSTKKVTKKVTHWMPLPEPPKMKGE